MPMTSRRVSRAPVYIMPLGLLFRSQIRRIRTGVPIRMRRRLGQRMCITFSLFESNWVKLDAHSAMATRIPSLTARPRTWRARYWPPVASDARAADASGPMPIGSPSAGPLRQPNRRSAAAYASCRSPNWTDRAKNTNAFLSREHLSLMQQTQRPDTIRFGLDINKFFCCAPRRGDIYLDACVTQPTHQRTPTRIQCTTILRALSNTTADSSVLSNTYFHRNTILITI